jgi:hypothetical protein
MSAEARKRVPLEQRFWAKVDMNGPKVLETPCWIWMGARSEGYGRIMVSSDQGREVTEFAHRLSFFWAFGYLPVTECRHRCHNRACVNPAHLQSGTRAQNMADMVESGRSLRGERQPRHRLTWAMVRDARERHAQGVSARQLALECGISERTMRQCLNGETWRFDPQER